MFLDQKYILEVLRVLWKCLQMKFQVRFDGIKKRASVYLIFEPR